MGTNLMRDLATENGNCFIVTPYGVKNVGDRSFDFDSFHREVTEKIISNCGLAAHRADSIYGPAGVLDAVWRGIQKAEVVVVDFTGRSPNVAIEFGWALVLGKRIIIVTQNEDDIPTDVRGLYRYIKYSEIYADVENLKAKLLLQLEAIRDEPAEEKMLSPMVVSTDPAPAEVIAVHPEFVTVKTDDARRGILGNTDVDYSRVIKDMTRRFSIGDRVNGAFVTDRKGSSKYTLLAGQTNPWPKLVSDYPSDTRLTGEVHSVIEGIGAFVQIGYGINGLIPASGLTAQPHLARGTKVEVSVSKVDDTRRRVDLRLERALNSTPGASQPDLPVPGARDWGEVCAIKPVQPGGGGGYVLLKLPGRDRPGMLLGKTMSDELRRDFDVGDIQRGDEIYVEVTSVDPVRDKVLVEDRLAPKEQDELAVA